MAAMTQQFDDTAKIILSNSSLSSQQQQQQQNHQHHNHMQLPVLSSHTAGHWTPLQPSALNTSDYTHDVAVSSRQPQPDDSRSVAPGVRRHQREMFDLGVSSF
jgi:hypothetical protein